MKFELAILAGLALTSPVASADSLLFEDAFNRADSPEVGNGWTDWWSTHPAGGDITSLAGGQVSVAHSSDGTNRDGGIFRPFAQASNLVVSGTVAWNPARPYASSAVTLNSGIGLEPEAEREALILSFGPSYLASSSIILSYDTNTFVQVPFNFDLSSPYNFEWTVHNDFSTEVRLWTTSQSRPVLASASSGALNVTLRADSHLGVLASGGAGCCAYPGYDLRFDNIAVVDTTPSASLLFRSNDPLSKEGTWGFGANPAKLPGIDADAVLIPGFDHVGLNVGERVYESHPGYGAGTYTDATGTESVNVRFVGGVQQQHSKGTFLNDAEIGASSPVEATDEIPIFYGIAEKMATFIEAQEGKPFLSISKSGLVAVHENPFDLAALSSSQQKGGTGSYTNVGLLERAAEQAGANGGQGFIPDVLEENDLVPLLSPALLHYALTHTAQMEAVLQNGSFLSGFFDPVDFILTDPEGRRIGHTGALGTLNEIPDAYYSGDGGIEMFFLPEVVAGDYTLELFSLGFEYFAGIGGQSGTIFSDRRFIEKGTTFLTTFRAVPIPTPIPAPLALLLSGLTCLGLSYRHRFASVASPLRAW